MSVYITKNKLSPTLVAKLEKDLTVISKTKKTTDIPKRIQFYIVDSGGVYIPYTYAAVLLREHLNHKLKYPIIDLTFKMKLYPKQEVVLQEMMTMVKKKGAGILNVPPGYGKTILGSKMIVQLKHPAVVLVHIVSLVKQWQKTFKDSLTETKVWTVGEKCDSTGNRAFTDPDIIICMDKRVSQIPAEYRKRVGTVIIDEAHCFCTEGRKKALLFFSPKYVIAETATLERTDGLESMIKLLCGENKVYREIENPFTVYKVKTGIEHPTRMVYQRGKEGLDWAHLVDQMVYSEPRNELIVSLIKSLPKHKILVLSTRTDHVDVLLQLLKGESVDSMYGDKETYEDSRILLGTTAKLGTGFDEANMCKSFNGIRIDVLILVSSFQSAPLVFQTVGRVFRADIPIVYDVVDNNGILQNHFRLRREWYTANKGTVLMYKPSVVERELELLEESRESEQEDMIVHGEDFEEEE